MPTNDNESPMNGAGPEPDAHGPAALLLVESLIHGLCERGTLGVSEAVAITERAVEVQHDHAAAADGAGAPPWRSYALLSRIAASLKSDEGSGLTPHLA